MGSEKNSQRWHTIISDKAFGIFCVYDPKSIFFLFHKSEVDV